MNWLNLETRTLHAPEFIGADPTARATWLAVILWSCEQENGGTVRDAAGWKDRQWQQTCGVTRAEVDAADPLLRWQGTNLLVWAYPADKEQEVRERRETARVNGRMGGRPPKKTNVGTNVGYDPETNVGTNVATNVQKRKEKEKEKEKVKRIATPSELGSPEEAIYALYPRHVARAAALRAITKAFTRVSVETLTEAVKAFAAATAEWPAADRKFIPHPASWFNADRWLDDRSTWQRSSTAQAGKPLAVKTIN